LTHCTSPYPPHPPRGRVGDWHPLSSISYGLFSRLPKKSKRPVVLSTKVIYIKAIEKLDLMYLDRKEREYYEAAQKAMRDSAEALITAKEEGREEGEKNKAVEMARRMKKESEPAEKISTYTGLSKKEIKDL